MVSSFQLIALCAFACLVAPSVFGSRAHKGFFDGLSEEQKEQVSTILHGGSTKAEIKEKLRHWVSTQPKETQDAFEAAEKAQEVRRNLIMAKHQQRLLKVSSPSKELDAKIREIYQDQSLTKIQTCEKIQTLIKGASEEVKKELKLKEKSCDE